MISFRLGMVLHHIRLGEYDFSIPPKNIYVKSNMSF